MTEWVCNGSNQQRLGFFWHIGDGMVIGDVGFGDGWFFWIISDEDNEDGMLFGVSNLGVK